jgi:hypothetical protein
LEVKEVGRVTGLAVKVAMATDMEESPSALILNQGHIVIFGIERHQQYLPRIFLQPAA